MSVLCLWVVASFSDFVSDFGSVTRSTIISSAILSEAINSKSLHDGNGTVVWMGYDLLVNKAMKVCNAG